MIEHAYYYLYTYNCIVIVNFVVPVHPINEIICHDLIVTLYKHIFICDKKSINKNY